MPIWSEIIESESMFMPLWPVKWILFLDYKISVKIILLGFLISSILSMIFWNKSRLLRGLSFLTIFLYLSFISSFGKIDHYLHLMTLTNFFLIFLPSDINTEKNKIS